MAKQVFRRSTWGSIYHEGEFIKETKAMVFYNSHGGRERRMASAEAVVWDTDNPAAVINAYQDRWRRHDAFVEEAYRALHEAKALQAFDAFHAAFPSEKDQAA